MTNQTPQLADEMKALEEAIDLAGGQTALANLIGKRQSHISTWLHRDKKVPPIPARLIDEALSGQVSKARLCPEAYGEPEQSAA